MTEARGPRRESGPCLQSDCFFVSFPALLHLLRWGTVDVETEVPSAEKPEVFCLESVVGHNSFSCFARCQEFCGLLCSYSQNPLGS